MFLTAFLCFVDFSEGRAKPTSLKSMCSDLDWGTAPPPLPQKLSGGSCRFWYYFIFIFTLHQIGIAKELVFKSRDYSTYFFFRNICIYGPVEIYLGTQTTYLGWVVFGWWVGVIQTPPPSLSLSTRLFAPFCDPLYHRFTLSLFAVRMIR